MVENSQQRANGRGNEKGSRAFPCPEPVIVGPYMHRDVLPRLRRMTQTSLPVLITGESGTGKELVAAYLHCHSTHPNGPFVAENLAALAEGVAESELYGHEEGAFTGAIALKKGLFELADGGTFFLDEIADASIALQAKLLRTLENKRMRRVGGGEMIPFKPRFISATNKDIKEAVAASLFREDLFYRISALTIDLQPLRKRGEEDLRALIEHFLRVNRRPDLLPTDEVMDCFLKYHWPGNVRELENVIGAACALCKHDRLTLDALKDANYEHIALSKCEALEQKGAKSKDRRLIALERILDSLQQHGLLRDLAVLVGDRDAQPTLQSEPQLRDAVLGLLGEHGEVRRLGVERMLGVSEHAARNILCLLMKTGLVETAGKGRSTSYRLSSLGRKITGVD